MPNVNTNDRGEWWVGMQAEYDCDQITGDHCVGGYSHDAYDGCIYTLIEVGHEETPPTREPVVVARVDDERTARFIVRACNAHDELVAACEWLMKAFQIHAPLHDFDLPGYAAAKAALAKAKGEPQP